MRQTAYQILVASSPENLRRDTGDLWASGKVAADQMSQVVYAGAPLRSSQRCWWKVKVWNQRGRSSAWSQPAQWTMGLLDAAAWQAQWITAPGAATYAHNFPSARLDFVGNRRAPSIWAHMPRATDNNYSSLLLRKEFVVAPRLARALVYVSGLGHYELSLNGRPVSEDKLAPGWTEYRRTVLYDTYDVTAQLRPGPNALGLLLSNGMYNLMPDSVRYVKFLNSYGPLKAIAQLRLEYADGTAQVLGTGPGWQAAPGPLTYMNEYGGEDYDARRLPTGWDRPGFVADARWHPAEACAGPGGQLRGLSCAAPPIRVIDTLAPVRVTRLTPTTWVYDLGQNAAIMPRLTLHGPPGASVRLIPAELLHPDGTVDRRSATQDGVRPAWWQYTKATGRPERWQPRFFYQGARYLQVELRPAPGSAELPVLRHLAGAVVHSSAAPIGSFACSNELFNRIHTLVRWAQRSNLMSVLTDCPHREKLPWLEQYHLNGPALRYNFDLLTLFTKGENDMADSQLDNGLVPNIAPEFFHAGADYQRNGFRNSPEWGSSLIIVPWQQYQFSGDLTLTRRYYEPMKRYLAFLDASARNHLLTVGLGDWYDIGPKAPWGSQLTPVPFTATAIYCYDYQLLARMAALLGHADDAARFERQAEDIRLAFNRAFYDPARGRYATGSNTAMAMPVFLNLCAPALRRRLVDTLAADIRRQGNAFTSGDVGYRFLLKALAAEGYSEVIFAMNNQAERPGYGYQLKQGATALTEKWDAGVGSFGSQNHFMLGQINEWFFTDLAGIGFHEDGLGAGFRRSVIKPTPVGDLTWAKGTYQTVSGLLTTEWQRQHGRFSLRVTIPANTRATVYVPAGRARDVTESGRAATQAEGVTFLRQEQDRAVFDVGSGTYRFEAPMP